MTTGNYEKFAPFENRLDLSALLEKVASIQSEIKKVIVGQEQMIELLLITLLTGRHSIIEGVPGVAKTLTARLLAQVVDTGFSRIQFTPDLMPSDITGTSILNIKNNVFEFIEGPIFSNIVLIDEINRAPAKTQAALFECMAENQVSVDGITHQLNDPFMVIATQNPIEQEGTYKLPEAQLDRFLFKIIVEYPSFEEEVELIYRHHKREKPAENIKLEACINEDEILYFKNLIQKIYVHEQIIEYIAKIVYKTRNSSHLLLGASPRASIAILEASKALAAINGRDFVTPEDIKYVLYPIIGHRVILTPEREMEGFNTKSIIMQIIESVEIPR
ncbi:MAG TPA: MoxR family ATPase [Chitinophagaceae bacterium]|nr:MoxR family ATPase [Chitinophagaceae bacterium]